MTTTLATRVIRGVPILIAKEDEHISIAPVKPQEWSWPEAAGRDAEGIIEVHMDAQRFAREQARVARSRTKSPKRGLLRRAWAAVRGLKENR